MDYNKYQVLNYDQEKMKFYDFILNFVDNNMHNHPIYGQKKYLVELQKIYNKEKILLEIEINDLEEYFQKEADQNFINNIKTNTYNYLSILSEVIDQISINRETVRSDTEEFEEVLNNFRLRDNENENYESKERQEENKKFKGYLKRKFQLTFKVNENFKINLTPFNKLNSKKIGSIVFVKGIITKTTEVRPLIDMACYLCELCGYEIYKKVNSKNFTPISECPSPSCEQNNKKGNVIPNFAISKFLKYQELVIQELTEDIATGSIPKSVKLICKGELTNKTFPGEQVLITGVFLPDSLDNHFNFDRLLHESYIEVLDIKNQNKRFSEMEIDHDLNKEIIELRDNPHKFEILANSICPEIFGHEKVKLGLLLQLIGGNDIQTNDGIKIRGNINIALVGDPGVAKSQMLKSICNISPRSIYTSGKGTTGAGLTASVIKEKSTNEITLEGGALVMSDLGICCIDEFDKMDERDRASIHEVMEQQTISIAKAGIVANLNARTSILAAANPIYGRYNKFKNIFENINLPHSLISRFDLIFILLDIPNSESDDKLAEHISKFHQKLDYSETYKTFKPIPARLLKAYISQAKTYSPVITEEVHNFIKNKFCEKRKESDDKESYITPRTLLSAIRLSQSIAKLRLSNIITKDDVNEAFELIEFSQLFIENLKNGEENNNNNYINNYNATNKKIKNIINQLYILNEGIFYYDLKKKAAEKGISNDSLNQYLENQEKICALRIDYDNNKIFLN